MDKPFVDVIDQSFTAETPLGQGNTNFNSVGIGTGSKVFRADSSGIWLGAAEFASAPFRVDMDGNAVMSSVNVTGYIPTGGAASDVNTSVTTINANRINISGSTNFTAGYDPTTKVASLGGNYASASGTGARVQIFPDSSTGIVAYDSSNSKVFEVLVGGSNVGDVIIGNYSGGNGMFWDDSASTFTIKGDMTAGNITGVNFQTASSGARVLISAGGSKIEIKDSGGSNLLELDDNVIIFASRSSTPNETNAIWYYKSGSNYGFRTRMESGNWQITQSAV